MKKKVEKTSDDHEVVTKGFLREQEFVTKSFLREQNFVTKEFLRQELAVHDKKLDKAVSIILKEIGAMRQENRQFHQMREQLYTNDANHERILKSHEARILKLEIA